MHGARHGVEHQHLIGREVKLDAWRIAGSAKRTAIADAPLGQLAAARVREDLELARLRRELEARYVVDPIGDLLEDPSEESFVQVLGILQREVEVLGEPVRFEVALLEASPSLEHPARAYLWMRGDPRKEPAQRIVLLDDMGLQLQLGCKGHQFLLGDQA